MKIVIEIKTDNAAFADNPQEAEMILKETAERIGLGDTDGILMDSNGNKVGKFRVTGK